MFVQSLWSTRDRHGGGHARRQLQQLRELRPLAHRTGAAGAGARSSAARGLVGYARAGGVALLAAALLLCFTTPSALGVKGEDKGNGADKSAEKSARDSAPGPPAHSSAAGGGQAAAPATSQRSAPKVRQTRGAQKVKRGGSSPKTSTSTRERSATGATTDATAARSARRSEPVQTASTSAARRQTAGSAPAAPARTMLRSVPSAGGDPVATAQPRNAAGGTSLRAGSPRVAAAAPVPAPATVGQLGATLGPLADVPLAGPPPLAATAPAPAPAEAAAPAPRGNDGVRPQSFLPIAPLLSPISRVVEVVPLEIWLALAGLALLSLLSTAVAAASTASARRTRHLARRAEREAVTDALTGVLNRRGFELRLDVELERARRYGRQVAVAYVDVDGLKSVNDGHGHCSGDAVLTGVAEALRAGSREGDLVARVGGDEFVVALVEQDTAGADRFAKRLRARIRVARAQLGLVSPWDVTVGTAAFPADGSDASELIAAADRRLYAQRGIEIAPDGDVPAPERRDPAIALV